LRSLVKNFKANAPQWAETLPEIPLLLHKVLTQADDSMAQYQNRVTKSIEDVRKEIRAANKQTFRVIVGASFVVSAVLMQALGGTGQLMFGNAPVITWMLGALGALILIFSWPGNR
jgi:ubiquinone biosynthesis protein